MPSDKKKMKKPKSSGSSNLSNKKKMKKPSLKPSPKMLGTGMARQAADVITERQKRMGKLMKEMGM